MTTEERLEKMERKLAETEVSLRRYRQMFGVGALAVVGLLTMAAVKNNEVVRAKRFIVMDDLGRERIVLAADLMALDKNGNPDVTKGTRTGLRLFDENGKIRASLGFSQSGTGLTLSDENGKIRTSLGFDQSGTGLDLSDENGKPRTLLGIGRGGTNLNLYDGNGKLRASLAAFENYRPALALLDENGNANLFLNDQNQLAAGTTNQAGGITSDELLRDLLITKEAP